MVKQGRPLRELCFELTAVALVNAGLPTWRRRDLALVETFGPRDHGIRAGGTFDAGLVEVAAKIERPACGFGRGTLRVGHPFQGHVWVDEVAVKIPPYKHWVLRCQGCNRQCRKVLWPPGGKAWRCRRCVKPRYPDKTRLESMPPRPYAPDKLDMLEREIRRMRLITRRMPTP